MRLLSAVGLVCSLFVFLASCDNGSGSPATDKAAPTKICTPLDTIVTMNDTVVIVVKGFDESGSCDSVLWTIDGLVVRDTLLKNGIDSLRVLPGDTGSTVTITVCVRDDEGDWSTIDTITVRAVSQPPVFVFDPAPDSLRFLSTTNRLTLASDTTQDFLIRGAFGDGPSEMGAGDSCHWAIFVRPDTALHLPDSLVYSSVTSYPWIRDQVIESPGNYIVTVWPSDEDGENQENDKDSLVLNIY